MRHSTIVGATCVRIEGEAQQEQRGGLRTRGWEVGGLQLTIAKAVAWVFGDGTSRLRSYIQVTWLGSVAVLSRAVFRGRNSRNSHRPVNSR